ncbi:MAG: hypothetical protein JWP02_3156 [Acidimicrobiales bacterium]|nr:hypothetical protein [Acidimicrobiales bacterium]
MTPAPCDSPFADRTVIVLGSVRSGTTWLVELLLAHPDLAGLNWESTVFLGLWELWENAHRSDGEGIGAHLSPDEIAAALRTFCDRTFAVARDADDAEDGQGWFVEKTPDNVNRLPLIAAAYPDAWFVHLVRDGRDVVRSQISAPWGTDDPADAARNWVWGVRQVERHRWRLDRFRELRYEDLVGDPVGETSALLEWLGLSIDAHVRRDLEERVGHHVARYGATDRVGPGKWRQMSAADLRRIDAVAGDLLSELGYLSGT